MKRLAVAAAIVVVDLFIAWMSMLFLGIAHGTDDRIPTFGYWTTFWLLWVLTGPVDSVMVARELRERTS